jgi:hypothetical protein
MEKNISYKISDSLYLVKQPLEKSTSKLVDSKIHHIVIIDCSGSMSWDLPKIREQMKKKLPKLLREKDTISIIWFSGKNQYGVLLEAEPVATLTDLQTVNAAIDRWLKPVGLTGFKEPMEEAAKLINKIKEKDGCFSLFFMSDGCDNQWRKQEILKAAEDLSPYLSSATFVEYGYYADRPMLTSMTEKVGGTLIFSEDFDKYAPTFEAAITKKVSNVPRIEINIGETINGFVFTLFDNDLMSFDASEGKVTVPENIQNIFYLSPIPVGKLCIEDKFKIWNKEVVSATYAAISLFALRMKSDIVYSLLKITGDVNFIEEFSTCFGKQRYSDFMDKAKEAAFKSEKRLVKGYDPDKVPDENAFTVLNLLEILAEDEENKILIEHPNFKYSRISRGRIDANERLSSTEVEKVQDLTMKIAGEKDVKKLKELQKELESITAEKGEALKFKPDSSPSGYSINSLTFNENRPNISILVKRPGTVNLSQKIPEKFKGKIPEKFNTFVYRNYTIIKDGLVNVDELPVYLTRTTVDKLEKAKAPEKAFWGLSPIDKNHIEVTINLRKLPVINRKMIKEISAQALFEKEYALTRARAAQKTYNSYIKEYFPRESTKFVEIYGKENADWLKELGITDYSGFNPKSVQADVRDFYFGKELNVKLKGFSSIPSLNDVKKRIASGKITPSAALMVPYVEKIEKFIKDKGTGKEFKGWLEERQKEVRNDVRRLLFELAKIKFSVIVGQTWFTEFSSLDENSMDLEFDGNKIACQIEMKEVQINI